MRRSIASLILCFSTVIANPWDISAEDLIERNALSQRDSGLSFLTNPSHLDNLAVISRRSGICNSPSDCPNPFVLQVSGSTSTTVELLGLFGAIAPDGCTSAVRFLIKDGELYDYNTNSRFATNQGVANALFPNVANIGVKIDDTFSLDTKLSWSNGNFRSSQASFCSLLSTGRIYAVFTISPPGCSPVQLVPSQCPDNPRSNATMSTLPACPVATNATTRYIWIFLSLRLSFYLLMIYLFKSLLLNMNSAFSFCHTQGIPTLLGAYHSFLPTHILASRIK